VGDGSDAQPISSPTEGIIPSPAAAIVDRVLLGNPQSKRYPGVQDQAVRFLERWFNNPDLPEPNYNSVKLLLETLSDPQSNFTNQWSTVLNLLNRSAFLQGYTGEHFECHLKTLLTSRPDKTVRDPNPFVESINIMTGRHKKERQVDRPMWELLIRSESHGNRYKILESLRSRVYMLGRPGEMVGRLKRMFEAESARTGVKHLPGSRIFPHERQEALKIAEQMDQKYSGSNC
jgi:hypothetical protein